MSHLPNPARTRLYLSIFFWALLGGGVLLFGWLWLAGPADIAADRAFRSARPCDQGSQQSCLTDLRGTIVSRREIELGKMPTTYQLTVRPEEVSRPPFSGPVHTTDGNFRALRAGEMVTLRYYRGDLTNVIAVEGNFRTDANPTEKAYQDEDLVQTLEWTVPIPLLPVGAYLLLTRRRRRPEPAHFS